MRRTVHMDVASGAAVTGTVTETSVAGYAFGVAELLPGRTITYRALVRCNSTTGATTLTVRVRFGSNATEASNTAVATGTATDVVNGDFVLVRGEIDVHSTTRMIHTITMATVPAATGVAAPRDYYNLFTSVADTAYYLDVTTQWSAADANSVRSETWAVYEDEV
jgi:hypothetical protein